MPNKQYPNPQGAPRPHHRQPSASSEELRTVPGRFRSPPKETLLPAAMLPGRLNEEQRHLWLKAFDKSWPKGTVVPDYVRQSLRSALQDTSPLAHLGGQRQLRDYWLPGRFSTFMGLAPQGLKEDGFCKDLESYRYYREAFRERTLKHRPGSMRFVDELLDKLRSRMIHPGVWLRFMIFTFPDLPLLLSQCSLFLPQGYQVNVLGIQPGSFLVVHVVPEAVSYYFKPPGPKTRTPLFYCCLIRKGQDAAEITFDSKFYEGQIPQLYAEINRLKVEKSSATVHIGVCMAETPIIPHSWTAEQRAAYNAMKEDVADNVAVCQHHGAIQQAKKPNLVAARSRANDKPDQVQSSVNTGDYKSGSKKQSSSGSKTGSLTSRLVLKVKNLFRFRFQEDLRKTIEQLATDTGPPAPEPLLQLPTLSTCVLPSRILNTTVNTAGEAMSMLHSGFGTITTDKEGVALEFIPDSVAFRISGSHPIIVDGKSVIIPADTVLEMKGISDVLDGRAALVRSRYPATGSMSGPAQITIPAKSAMVVRDGKAVEIEFDVLLKKISGVLVARSVIPHTNTDAALRTTIATLSPLFYAGRFETEPVNDANTRVLAQGVLPCNAQMAIAERHPTGPTSDKSHTNAPSPLQVAHPLLQTHAQCEPRKDATLFKLKTLSTTVRPIKTAVSASHGSKARSATDRRFSGQTQSTHQPNTVLQTGDGTGSTHVKTQSSILGDRIDSHLWPASINTNDVYADALFEVHKLDSGEVDSNPTMTELADKAFTPKNKNVGHLTPGEWLVKEGAAYYKDLLIFKGVKVK